MADERSGVKLRPIELRGQLHEHVLELRREGLSYSRIIAEVERLFGVRLSKSHISGWVRGSNHPYGSVRALDTTSRPELAYVIGVTLGDASMSVSHYNYMIKLRVIDNEFAEEFARCLSVILLRGSPKVRWHAKTHAWHTELSSLLLRLFLLQPLSKLGETIRHCDACKGAFLKGFFDSEGSVSGRELKASNGNLESLRLVCDVLSSLGVYTTGPHILRKGGRLVLIKGRFYHQNRDQYGIRVRTASLGIFQKKVGFSIHRKSDALSLALGSG